jgi:predicted heme/steroid binding protein
MVIGVGSIVAAFVYVNRPGAAVGTVSSGAGATAAAPKPTATGAVVTLAALAQHDGQDGRQCYVAVDGTVYLIENSGLWVGGRHVPSGGRATCGRDLTTVIDQSPHGRSKLLLLTVVGKLET